MLEEILRIIWSNGPPFVLIPSFLCFGLIWTKGENRLGEPLTWISSVKQTGGVQGNWPHEICFFWNGLDLPAFGVPWEVKEALLHLADVIISRPALGDQAGCSVSSILGSLPLRTAPLLSISRVRPFASLAFLYLIVLGLISSGHRLINLIYQHIKC